MIATESHHHPYTSLISFVPSYDFFHIYFPTRKKTQKFLNITKNPHVAILFDNRENSPVDLSEAITIIALGAAHEVKQDTESIKTLLLQKHPALSGFLSNPDCTLIDIHITTYQIVQKFEQVRIIHLRDVPR